MSTLTARPLENRLRRLEARRTVEPLVVVVNYVSPNRAAHEACRYRYDLPGRGPTAQSGDGGRTWQAISRSAHGGLWDG